MKIKHNFDSIFKLNGQVFREQKNRKTLRFIENNRAYFIKIHTGVGYKEIFKNLFQGKLPVIGARNEINALLKLKKLGFVPEAVDYGFQGKNPANQFSFIITKAIENTISLEDLCKNWPQIAPSVKFKWTLINKIANIARSIHDQGINHRDFYLCHFLLDKTYPEDLKITVIDWHRAQSRSKVPQRWRVKDIAGLYFSAMDIGLTSRDLRRFVKAYNYNNKPFWIQVEKKALCLYQKLRKHN